MQKDSIATQIYERIKEVGHDEVYIVGDFLDLSQYHAVRKALLRLDEAGKIQKIMRGVYYCPRYSELIDEYEAPSPGKAADIASATQGAAGRVCKAFFEKKAAYAEYYQTKEEYRELLTYQANLSDLFGIENEKAEPQKERRQEEK